jgi:Abnormal spindle-like microcephaly-assoc'd, ASPM-SPD-2-Hydin
MKCFPTFGVVQRKRAAQLATVLLCVATMVGCQGVSTSSSTQPPPTGTLSLSGATLDFGTVTAGTSKTLTVTVSNTGTASVTVSSVTISTKYFLMSAPSLPVTIPAGQSTPVTVVFSPNVAGAFTALASIASDASNGLATVSLKGAGISSAQLVVSPASKSFGGVTVGTQSSQTVTLTNSTTSTVNISQASVSGTGFTLSGITAPVALNASQSTTFTVTFSPQAAGSASGSVTITSDAPNPTLSMALSGTGLGPGALGANPTSLSYGTVQTGKSQALSETLTNTGGSSVIISKVGVTGTGFTFSGITPPVTVAAGQTATFTVTFAPLSATSASGTVTVTSNGSNPSLTIPLTGTGSATAGVLTAAPTPVAEGSVVAGTSATASGTLSASGANVTVTAASSSNSRFAISGLSLPVIIPAGQSAPFTITYSPLVAGADSATLTFTSTAQTATTTDTATGTATPAPVHSVALSWIASTSANISGYNIYRAVYVSSCGGFSKINGATLNTGTTYADSVVTNGTNYCYATTAVDSTNVESAYSNIVSNVQIP